MAYYLEVPLDTENTILVDVTARVEGVVPAGAGEVVERMGQTLERALDRLEPLTSSVVRRLSAISESADHISVEFGISLTGKAGVVVAETTAQSHFKITLEWEGPGTPERNH
jgi:NTP-dependent ternary system trypsin peptidase co-occuring protein